MSITMEQARTLDAFARLGSFSKTATELNKVHSAIVYTLKTLEEQIDLKLLERTGYRTCLTPEGTRIWQECKKLLQIEGDIENISQQMRTGWEPYLSIVYDGFFPFQTILRALLHLQRQKVSSKVSIFSEFLDGVEKTFVEKKADLMISLLPVQTQGVKRVRLPKQTAHLVVRHDHPLARGRVHFEDLVKHTFLTVKGSDFRLHLSTSELDEGSHFQLNDFHAKKQALLKGLGYGWIHEELIAKELESETLKVIKWDRGSTHRFQPHLYYRDSSDNRPLGAAGKILLSQLVGR